MVGMFSLLEALLYIQVRLTHRRVQLDNIIFFQLQTPYEEYEFRQYDNKIKCEAKDNSSKNIISQRIKLDGITINLGYTKKKDENDC